MKTEILYGAHPVMEALAAGRRNCYHVFLAEGKTGGTILSIEEKVNALGIALTRVHRQKLQELTGLDTHQGVAAKVSPYPVLGLVDLLANSQKPSQPAFFLMLDAIQDAGNLGALIRTALCAGATGVVLPKDRSATPSPAVSKASAGALEHIRLAVVVNMAAAVQELKKQGVWVTGLDSKGDRPIYETDFTTPCALMVGGEEKGIRPLVKKHCDFLRHIPQNGPVGSLNASAAGAIAMYEVRRQRNARDTILNTR